MKLRSMIGFCALAIAAFGLESNTCGLMNVPSDQATTMIAVPWLNVGGGNVEVAKLVKTDTLTAGDELYYYDGANYNRWVLSAGKEWEPSAVSNSKGTFVSPAADLAVARGKGLFLVRQSTASEIWLYGQNSTDAVSTTVTAGTAKAPVYNMIANPNTADRDLNSPKVAGTSGDQIILADGTVYNYGTAWTKTVSEEKTVGSKTVTVKKQSDVGVVIPAGQGAWYLSKGGSPTIAW